MKTFIFFKKVVAKKIFLSYIVNVEVEGVLQ